jgi:hypothetical protein
MEKPMERMTTTKTKTRPVLAALLALCLLLNMVAFAFVAGCGAPSAPSNQEQPKGDAQGGSGTAGSDAADKVELPAQVVVDIDVDCLDAVTFGNEVAAAQAPDGKLFTGKVAVEEGQSALDALKATGLNIVTQDFSGSLFVDSIQGLAPGATEAMSGWTFTVNGETPMLGMNEVILQEGDVVVVKFVNEF